MTIIELNKKLYTIPTCWNELTRKQLLSVMESLFVKAFDINQGRLQLLKILTGMSWWQFFRTSTAQLQEFFYLTDFIISDRTNLTRQILEEYRGLYGPASDFDNLLMSELALCDNLFMRWSEERDKTEYLDELISMLYRPVRKGTLLKRYDKKINPEGDVREEFNQNKCFYRARKIVKHWPLSVKLAIATWYDGCRWQMVDENEEVFGGSGNSDVSKYGLVSVMLSVAETGTFGDFNKVEKQFVKTVMMQLNDSIARAREMEKQMK